MAEGLGNAEIAERLSISEKTVRNHVSNVFDKLGVWTRAQAIVFARDRHSWAGRKRVRRRYRRKAATLFHSPRPPLAPCRIGGDAGVPYREKNLDKLMHPSRRRTLYFQASDHAYTDNQHRPRRGFGSLREVLAEGMMKLVNGSPSSSIPPSRKMCFSTTMTSRGSKTSDIAG